MRDEQLVRALERKEVTIARPVPEQNQEWFNLLAVHQNRAKSSSTATSTNAVKETLLPDCMDIVIWGARTASPERPHTHTRSHAPLLLLPPSCRHTGHERECTIGMGMDGVPETSDDSLKFSVLQPGAAVATELTEVEAKKKSVGILMIKGEDWKLESLPLTTVRQQQQSNTAAKAALPPHLTTLPSCCCTHYRCGPS